MYDLVSQKEVLDILCDPNEDDKIRIIEKVFELPSVPAVPLEPLAKWIVENLDPRCGCSYCSRDRVCCDCPTMTEQQVKEELTKWMEEQDAAD